MQSLRLKISKLFLLFFMANTSTALCSSLLALPFKCVCCQWGRQSRPLFPLASRTLCVCVYTHKRTHTLLLVKHPAKKNPSTTSSGADVSQAEGPRLVKEGDHTQQRELVAVSGAEGNSHGKNKVIAIYRPSYLEQNQAPENVAGKRRRIKQNVYWNNQISASGQKSQEGFGSLGSS